MVRIYESIQGRAEAGAMGEISVTRENPVVPFALRKNFSCGTLQMYLRKRRGRAHHEIASRTFEI